jgi:hypothetical protein
MIEGVERGEAGVAVESNKNNKDIVKRLRKGGNF